MSCRRFRPLVALWVGGDLAPRRAGRVEAHVARCEACRMLAERLRSDHADLAALGNETPDRTVLELVRQRVLASLRVIPGGAAPGRTLSWFPTFGWKGAVVAVLLAAAAVVLLTVGRPIPGPEVPSVGAVRPTAHPAPVASTPLSPQQTTTGPSASERRVASGVSAEHPRQRLPASPVPRGDREAAAQPLVIKIVTDDPDVVIYWLVGGQKG